MIDFSIATASDVEAIHELNYLTFTEEIPQHQPNTERKRIDRFHDQNTYLIGKEDNRLVAMIAIRKHRPFSLEEKGVTLDETLTDPAEIRLLSVRPEYRNSRTFMQLMRFLMVYLERETIDHVYISGTTREAKLYARFGFTPIAATLGSGDAQFVPMLLSRATYERSVIADVLRPLHFLAGPVEVAPTVRQAAQQAPRPHRTTSMRQLDQDLRDRMCQLLDLPHVSMAVGSGTLANDIVAQQLSGHGLILNGGEFGQRLIDHAARAGKSFDIHLLPSGHPIDLEQLASQLHQTEYDWIWLTHCETSTGVLYDLDAVKVLLVQRTALIVDAISAVGTGRFSYAGCRFVTTVSGKAIGGLPGLAFIGHTDSILPSPRIPRYLDLGLYAEGVAFSGSSNLLLACQAALDALDLDQAAIKMTYLEQAVRATDFNLLATQEAQAPGILTIVHPSATALGDALRIQGYHVQYESDYLVHNQWLQISTMGQTTIRHIERLIRVLVRENQRITIKNERNERPLNP